MCVCGQVFSHSVSLQGDTLQGGEQEKLRERWDKGKHGGSFCYKYRWFYFGTGWSANLQALDILSHTGLQFDAAAGMMDMTIPTREGERLWRGLLY